METISASRFFQIILLVATLFAVSNGQGKQNKIVNVGAINATDARLGLLASTLGM